MTLPSIVLGIAPLTLAAIALATGSLAPLAPLVLTIVVLWALARVRDVRRAPRHPTAT
jgi:hypothetical protein